MSHTGMRSVRQSNDNNTESGQCVVSAGPGSSYPTPALYSRPYSSKQMLGWQLSAGLGNVTIRGVLLIYGVVAMLKDTLYQLAVANNLAVIPGSTKMLLRHDRLGLTLVVRTAL